MSWNKYIQLFIKKEGMLPAIVITDFKIRI